MFSFGIKSGKVVRYHVCDGGLILVFQRFFKCQGNERRIGVPASTFAEHSAHSRNIISGTPERECCWLPT
jgi:hypothetical protein